MKIAIALCSAMAGFLFLAARVEAIADLLYTNQTDYGDLMPELNVTDFKVDPVPPEMPRLPENETADPNQVPLLLIGDSFCRRGYNCHPFADELSLYLQVPVVWWSGGSGQTRPFSWLESQGVKYSDKPRTLIFECVERNLLYYYEHDELLRLDANLKGGEQSALDLASYLRDFSRRWLGSAETQYAYLANTSVVSAGIVEGINTFKYHQFGTLPKRFEVFSAQPPMVFTYFETASHVNTSYFYDHSPAEIHSVANTIAYLRDELKRQYNLDLVLLIVPNKLTIYHELATNVPYDNLLPRMYDALDSAGVKTVQLYPSFRGSSRRLYLAADTHWNEQGLKLGVQLTAEALRADSLFPQPSSIQHE